MAFQNCNGLSSVIIPESVTAIGNDAFNGCTSLITVHSYIKEPFNVSIFSNETYRNGTLYVPAGTKDLYIRFDGWREFLKIEEMGNTPPAPYGKCPALLTFQQSRLHQKEPAEPDNKQTADPLSKYE